MATRRGRGTRRRVASVGLAGVGALALAGVLGDWRLPLVVVAAGVVGAVAWWSWRTHRSLRARDRTWRDREHVLDSHRRVADLDGMRGEAFEEVVAALLRRDGCHEVRRVGGAGDRGVDVVGRLPDGRSLAVQCKRYAPTRKVTSRDMITLVGSRAHYGADVAMCATTASLTRPAERDAVTHGILALHRDHLGHWLNGATVMSFFAVNGGGQGRAGRRGR